MLSPVLGSVETLTGSEQADWASPPGQAQTAWERAAEKGVRPQNHSANGEKRCQGAPTVRDRKPRYPLTPPNQAQQQELIDGTIAEPLVLLSQKDCQEVAKRLDDCLGRSRGLNCGT